MRMLGLYPKQIITKILCYSLLLAIVSFFLYVVAISNITFFTPYLQKYDAEITTRLSVFFAHKVKVGEVSFAKHKLQPVLLLRDLDVFNANSDKPLLHVNELSVQINVWRSLLAKRIVEEGVTINGTVLSMQTGGKSSLSINGMDLGGIQQGADGVSVPANGGIKIRMVNVTVVAAQWFAKPLIIDELHGKVSWRRSAQEMSIAIKNFVLQSQSLRAHGDVALTKILSDKLLPYVDTRIYFSCTQLEELQNFYPSKIMKVGLLHWLNAAFSAGYIDGEFDLHGNLSHFPFDDNNGVFKVNIDLHALDFFYHQYWPKIRQLNGRLLFHGNSMEVIADSAIISGAPLRNVHASISNLYLPRLIVVGQVNTTASLAQNFLATSPLSSSFGRYNNYVKLEGPVIIEISMEIPLTEFANASANESQVHGKINFLNDTLGLSSAPTGFPMDSSGGVSGDNSGMVSSQREASCGDVKSCNSKANSNTKSSKLLEILWHNIVGTINFNNTTIWADNLKATLFDKPLTMHIKTADDVIDGGSSRVVRLVFDHSVSIAMVKQYLKWPIFNFLQGNIDYRAVLRLPQRQSENITLGITSNLQNVSIAYPPLLTKALGVSHDFNMRIVFPNDEMWAANIFMCYKDEFSSALGFVKKQSHLEFVAGELHFGKHAVTKILTDNGLVVSGRIRQLNWSDWQSYLSPGKNKNKRGDKKFELELAGWVKFIKKIDLVIDELNIFGNAFSDLHLLVVPQEDGWAVNLDNKLISGVLSVPYDWSDGVLVAGLSKLYLANSKIFKNSNFNPGDFPKMQIMINDLRYAGKMLGKLELKTEPITNGLSVVRLLISAANFTLEGTGKMDKDKTSYA